MEWIWSRGVFETSKWSSTIDKWGSGPETQDKDVGPKCRTENHEDNDCINRRRWGHCRAIRGKATFEEPWPWREPAFEKGIEGAKEGEEEDKQIAVASKGHKKGASRRGRYCRAIKSLRKVKLLSCTTGLALRLRWLSSLCTQPSSYRSMARSLTSMNHPTELDHTLDCSD